LPRTDQEGGGKNRAWVFIKGIEREKKFPEGRRKVEIKATKLMYRRAKGKKA